MTLLSRILLLLIVSHLVSAAYSQQPPHPGSNLRIKKIAVADSVLLDTLSIVPGTFAVKQIDTSFYSVDFTTAVLRWRVKPEMDSVSVVYRVFPYKLNATVQRWSYDSVVSKMYAAPYQLNKSEARSNLFDFGNIRYSGSFGRALAFGNNQDAVVNSNFQLQLNGMLKDSIEIAAALTDNNIPIQPDGTTQQLNEFDQVFLQFKKKNWELSLGDIDIRQNNMYFLNFYKRLQGVSYQTKNYISPSVQSQMLVSGSIAKGKFNRNIIDRTTYPNLEGNQGPYRLQGANKEFFFIVLPNTERVFLDGELLQRGEDQDYIINYNTAELTFMPRRMITKDSRIQVEFEYADRNFLNSNLYLFQEFSFNNKVKIRFSAFSNVDAKNSQINQSLDSRQKQFLFNVGDSIQNALYPAVSLDSFASDKILYEKVFYANGSVTDSFYKYSVDPSAAHYALSFTDMGQGNGNYIAEFNGTNGKVYSFVKPVNGVRQGRFEPVTVLVTPKKQQLYTLGTELNIDANNKVTTEVAVSNYDVNTFSTINSGDDKGVAARLQYTNTAVLNSTKNLQLISTVDYEHVAEKFKPVERLRMVEFSREWGLPTQINAATENIFRLSTQLKQKNNQSLSYQFMTYQRSDDYKGYQNILQQVTTIAGWNFNNQLAYTTFSSFSDKGSYLRPVFDMSKVLKQFASMRLGFRYAMETNEIRHKHNDSIGLQSFSFDTYTAYLKSDDRRKNKYNISFFTRSDKYPTENKLMAADRSYNTNVQAELTKSEKHRFFLSSTYRILNVYNKAISKQKPDRTMLGRMQYLVNEWKGMITGDFLYELGTGQEQRRDFAYIEVPAGQGEYTWIDYNSDAIQQINEFEVAVFRDQAKYIRVLTPSNQFTKANYTTLNYSVQLNPKALLGESSLSPMMKFMSKWQLQSSLQKTKKSIAKDAANSGIEFNPFKYNLQDTSLLTNTTSLINTLSFNRLSPVWGFDISNYHNSGKALLTYGYETRVLRDWLAKVRWNVGSSIAVDVNNKLGLTALYTPKFSNRNYEITTLSTEPRVSFVQGTVFRVQASYKVEVKSNAEIFGGERSTSNALNFESKYNVLQNSSINGRFTYNNISFAPNADPVKRNPSVEYIIMDAQRPGANYLWAVDFTKKLMNNLELNFQYDGRRPADSRTIHTGRAAIRALF